VEGAENLKLGDGSRLASRKTSQESLGLTIIRIPLSEEIALAAGNLLRTYRRSHGTELGDALIASTAIELGATLITRNVKHYPMPAVTVLRPY
jgi:predicted nucleic acid-binding protein